MISLRPESGVRIYAVAADQQITLSASPLMYSGRWE
jgi:hypothetical protein